MESSTTGSQTTSAIGSGTPTCRRLWPPRMRHRCRRLLDRSTFLSEEVMVAFGARLTGRERRVVPGNGSGACSRAERRRRRYLSAQATLTYSSRAPTGSSGTTDTRAPLTVGRGRGTAESWPQLPRQSARPPETPTLSSRAQTARFGSGPQLAGSAMGVDSPRDRWRPPAPLEQSMPWWKAQIVFYITGRQPSPAMPDGRRLVVGWLPLQRR